MSTLSKTGRRLVVNTVGWGAIFSAAIIFILLVQPNAFASIRELPLSVILVMSFLLWFWWQYRRLNHIYSESERDESQGTTSTTIDYFGDTYAYPLLTLIIPLLYLTIRPEDLLMLFNALLFIQIPGFIGILSAILLWERRKNLYCYRRNIGPRQWLISFTKKTTLVKTHNFLQ